MIIVRILFVIIMLFTSVANASMTRVTDSRIKTYIYNPNEVYLLVLHYGFRSHIEFAKPRL